MTPLERRAGASLATLFGLRMLGLFLILPVFAVHAETLAGGSSAFLVGLALGIYGLTQGALQIPFGMASDRFGRKRVIVIGLVIFAAGSFIAAAATDIHVTILGRAIQGAGAISAAVVALLADLTSEENRTKAMAMVGATIGLTFALSLMAAPALYQWIGMDGIFILTGVLALGGIIVTLRFVPPEGSHAVDPTREVKATRLRDVLANAEMLRLNLGVFVLHAMQMAIFVVIPLAIVKYGRIAVGDHWKIYLPVVLVSFALMMPPILYAERNGRVKALFLAAIALLLVVQAGLALWSRELGAVIVLLLAFFVAFNILEASLPSLVSKLAPAAVRGTAIGVYNTTQAIGLFAGGAAGGWIFQQWGERAVFVFGIALVALWLIAALPMRAPTRTTRPPMANAATTTKA